MADTAYERFLKDPDKEEAVEVDIKNQQPLDLDQVKLKIQNELSFSKHFLKFTKNIFVF